MLHRIVVAVALTALAAGDDDDTRSREPLQGTVDGLPGYFGIGKSPLHRYRSTVRLPCPLWYPEAGSPWSYEYLIVRGSPDQSLNGLYIRREERMLQQYDHWYPSKNWENLRSNGPSINHNPGPRGKPYQEGVDINNAFPNGNWEINKWEDDGSSRSFVSCYHSRDDVCLLYREYPTNPDIWDSHYCPETGWQAANADTSGSNITVECYYPRAIDEWLERKQVAHTLLREILGTDLANLVAEFALSPHPSIVCDLRPE